MLSFDAVALRHASGFALAPLTLAVTPGCTTALVGPSGCGKSTALRLAAGLLSPDAGRVLIGGQAMSPATAQALRLQIGYVLQEGGLFAHLSASQNITVMARHLGWTGQRIDTRLAELLELTRLPPELLARRPASLSGGERQRVSLARALMLDPAVLLLDEPLGALDPIVRHDLQRDLRLLFRRLRKTVLLVTHDVAEAGYLADELVLMRSGAVVQHGSLARLVAAPADDFVRRFVHAQRQLGEVLGESG